jgi:SAM-dependent methyltransferase
MEPTEENLRAWDEVHGRGQPAALEPRIPDEIRARLPALDGKHVLHLGSGTGEASAELTELGGLVTGVELGDELLTTARGRAPNAAFVPGDPQDLPLELRRGRFDVVYAGPGLLARAEALEPFLHGVVGALKAGGLLAVYDLHPAGACVDAFRHWRESYFERRWPLGVLISAIADAGLVVRRLDELPSLETLGRPETRLPAVFLLLAEKSH